MAGADAAGGDRDATVPHAAGVLARGDLDSLMDALRADGRGVIGPRIGSGAVVYDAVATASELPIGLGSVQSPGSYRLTDRGDDRLFDYGLPLASWKSY